MSYEPSAEILALIDHSPIHEATAENDAAGRAFDAVAAQAKDAEAALRDARAALPALLNKAIEGEKVSDKAIVDANRRAVDAQHVHDFRKEVLRRLAPSQVEADARLSAARAKAYAAVLDYGIDGQIRAAERGDKAAGTVDRNQDAAEWAAAKAEFEHASRIVLFATQNGARPVRQLRWPITAYQVRREWGREEPAKEAA